VQPVDATAATLPLIARRAYYPLRIRLAAPMDDEALFELCRANRDLRIERTADGEIIAMPPTGGETSRRNAVLTAALTVWATTDGTGVAFDSSGGFILPNGAERAPDAAWIKRERWDALSIDERDRFPPLCPDFVVELGSPSDDLDELHAKMREYMVNGARLGWLIDPASKRVWVYSPGAPLECLEQPQTVSGEPLMPGFVLELSSLW
jgi:Uma2 family endonuclease